VGKMSSVSPIIEKLKEVGVSNWAVTDFVQGNRTRRWAVAWSWTDMRPGVDVARGRSSLPKHLLPFPSEFSFNVAGMTIDTIGQRINKTLDGLHLQWQWRQAAMTGVGFANENVWSRASRRRGKAAAEGTPDEIDESEAALGFKVQVKRPLGGEGSEVVIRWLKGHDAVLFESFCGMLKRKVEAG